MNGYGSPLGANLESACQAYQATKVRKWQLKADEKIEETAKHKAGSEEWKAAVKEYLKVVEEAKKDGVELVL